MAVIIGSEYRDIAVLYANARTSTLLAKEDLFDAVYEIVLLNVIRPEVDLLNTFWDTYLINTDLLSASTNLLSAVRVINQHVLIQGSYSNLDAYFAAEGITVPQLWADLCLDAGFVISSQYISG
jgi:hypothetical protein